MSGMTAVKRSVSLTSALIAMACIAIGSPTTTSEAGPLKVKVLKACPDCELPAAPEACQSASMHQEKAATWTPQKDIRIYAVSIPEQSDIAIYADIEVTTAPKMYLPDGHIFRVKYAGPGIVRNPPCPRGPSYAGSNVTTTNISFPSGWWISVRAGTPIYVHIDVKNWSPLRIERMTQDVYIYYSD